MYGDQLKIVLSVYKSKLHKIFAKTQLTLIPPTFLFRKCHLLFKSAVYIQVHFRPDFIRSLFWVHIICNTVKPVYNGH